MSDPSADKLRDDAEWLETYPGPGYRTVARDLRTAADEIERLRAELAQALDPDRLKAAVCEALLELNGDDPIVPPTAVNWIGNAIVSGILEQRP